MTKSLDDNASAQLIDAYFETISQSLSELQRCSADKLKQVGEQCADSIANEHIAWVFGAGHSALMALEAYPRMGGVQGLVPIVEPSLILFQNVVGIAGMEQTLTLERTTGFADAILDSYDVQSGDTMIIFSSSGVEPLIIEMARGARARSATTVGVTSMEYSSAAMEGRGLSTRLADEVDIVIDNLVQIGDATTPLPTSGAKVAPMSSVMGMMVINSIAIATAASLEARGVTPIVFGSPHLGGSDADQFRQRMRDYREMFARRTLASERNTK